MDQVEMLEVQEVQVELQGEVLEYLETGKILYLATSTAVDVIYLSRHTVDWT